MNRWIPALPATLMASRCRDPANAQYERSVLGFLSKSLTAAG
jgi:hypothetical protein